jgi:hypothetical protein
MEAMAPGVISRDGFLGEDKRPVSEIIEADVLAAERAGCTIEQIGRRMSEIFHKAQASQGADVEVGHHLVACCREAMGHLPCPFGDGLHEKGEVEVRDKRTGETIIFTPLGAHMIGTHGFFEGTGGRYRIGPAKLCHFLFADETEAG